VLSEFSGKVLKMKEIEVLFINENISLNIRFFYLLPIWGIFFLTFEDGFSFAKMELGERYSLS
jgi:hypothetical protein